LSRREHGQNGLLAAADRHQAEIQLGSASQHAERLSFHPVSLGPLFLVRIRLGIVRFQDHVPLAVQGKFPQELRHALRILFQRRREAFQAGGEVKLQRHVAVQ